MKREKAYIGVDVGGTSCKAALVSAAGSVLAQVAAPTPALQDEASCKVFCGRIHDELLDAAQARGAACVFAGAGLAVPGAVGSDGKLSMAPNVEMDLPAFVRAAKRSFGDIWSVQNDANAAALGERAVGSDGKLSMAPNVEMDLPAFVRAAKRSFGDIWSVQNDANAAALGEQWAGAAREFQSVLFVTLGTGIGAGVVVEGRVVVGAHGSAGEIGHIVVDPEGAPCGCGGCGCVEQYASARGLVRLARREIAESETKGFAIAHDSDARAVFDAARAGDPRAAAAVRTMSRALAQALAAAVCVIDPEAVVIGGGMSGSADVFLDELRQMFLRFAIPPCKQTSILTAQLGNDAGMIGAARAAMLGEGEGFIR